MQQFDVIVIGGGATGVGVARDAAMRGFRTLLIEQNSLGSGTSGKYHGLLHSGARYAVNDPESAKECVQENVIIKKIARFAVDDTGGLFIATEDDDPDFSKRFLESCKAIGIAIDEITPAKALEKEPLLNPKITRVFTVPDAVCDSQKLIRMNVESAQLYGATILANHAVVGFTINGKNIQAVQIVDKRTGLKSIISCQFVINAGGIWAGNIAQMADIPLSISAVKGSMAVMNGRLTNTVLNRCHMPSDGDILLPKSTTSIIGTTSVQVTDFDNVTPTQSEIDLLMREGDKLIKDFSKRNILYTYAGVRPLYTETATANEIRSISRSYTCKNHKDQGVIDNMVTITGGKLTTYRAMAQTAVDAMCQNLNTQRTCTTMNESLPSIDMPRQKWTWLTKHFLTSRFNKSNTVNLPFKQT